ncbi:hypothetical protein LA080_000891 [Diaporthe eres]|nr:hypothetical protein LA080_000891 [Diaporthe eres]
MTPLAHTPQDVLETVRSLARLSPRVHNVSFAQWMFVKIYKQWSGRDTHDDMRQLLDSGHIRSAMVALDTYFFGKALTITTLERNWAALGELYVEGNVFGEGHIGHALRPDAPAYGLVAGSWRGDTAMYLDAFDLDGSPRTIKELLGTLVHEMAHALYESFACRGRCCNQLDPEVLGVDGHGRLWVDLVKYMRDKIRSWDKTLEDFYDDFCDVEN